MASAARRQLSYASVVYSMPVAAWRHHRRDGQGGWHLPDASQYFDNSSRARSARDGKSRLTADRRESTIAKDFGCKACGAEFNTREGLEAHNKKAHPAGVGPGGGAGQKSGTASQRPARVSPKQPEPG
jgi:hypothetical protein